MRRVSNKGRQGNNAYGSEAAGVIFHPAMQRSEPSAAELTEVGRLFRAKVQQLQDEQDRTSRRARKLAAASRRRSKLEAIDAAAGR
jgi:hypothetical protein